MSAGVAMSDSTLKWLTFALVCVFSYAVQRLVDAQSEPPMGTVLMQESIPYYWRVGISVAHGVAAVVLLSIRLSWDSFPRASAPWRWALGTVVVAAAMAMLVVP